ncbi:hypothetical protein KIN20_015534 [Parelaphostrongylus tenuis]|uniref:Peptidase M12A domain-containing protein n=1 Tax=Parelaphostrongylus tenuis TaxID=148309 RepID=A0AAD5QQ00_PARTN|nr:hypothetical protein KIN20_015534 [Parelaphostrongylus tenuis]
MPLASDKILVINEVGCWSHVGKIGGTQGLSLGKGCDNINAQKAPQQNARMEDFLIQGTALNVFALVAMEETFAMKE